MTEDLTAALSKRGLDFEDWGSIVNELPNLREAVEAEVGIRFNALGMPTGVHPSAKVRPGDIYRSYALAPSEERWWRVESVSPTEVTLSALTKGEGTPAAWDTSPQNASYVCRALGNNFERWTPCQT